MDFSPPSAHLHLGALHRGLQASSGVSLATGAMCRLSKLLFLHQVSLVARIMLRKEKKGTDPFQYEWISTVCLCSPGCKKKRCAYWNNIFFSKHLYGPELFSANTDREGAGVAVCLAHNSVTLSQLSVHQQTPWPWGRSLHELCIANKLRRSPAI